MKNTSVRHALKSTSCDYQNKQEGTQKKSQGLLQSKAQNNGQEKENSSCLDTSISSVALEDSPWQRSNLGEYKQLSLLKSTPTLKQSCDRTSQEYQFTLISETISLIMESLILLPADSPVLAQVMQELEQVLSIPPQLYGKKVLESSRRRNPNSWWLNNQQEFSNEDYELFLEDSEWQDIKAKLKLSRRVSLEQDTKDSDYLSFPTLTSGQTSTTMRPAGQTKCEKWFRNKGLIPSGSQLGSEAIATIMGFPPNWFDCLSPTKPQAESEVDISQVEPSPQDRQPSPSAESFISIPCLIKQPHKKSFEGLIVGDHGSEFDVQVGDRVVQLPKLYVFPNPPKRVKYQTDDDISPSKISQRRKKGTGSGYINWRDIRKNGKDYKQTWFHYELWDKGRQVKSCAYIPKGKRSQVEKMNAEKVPVEEILKFLGNKLS
jgi:hypothetical protein